MTAPATTSTVPRGYCAKCGGPGRVLKSRSRKRPDGKRTTLIACIPCSSRAGTCWTEFRSPSAQLLQGDGPTGGESVS